MENPSTCRNCGAPLTGDAREGFCPECLFRLAGAGTVRVSPPDEEEIGTCIGRYKLLEKVGEGGFGAVYVAEQREPVKRRVALKIIKLGMDTRQVIARFEAERQALALMDHPNIARVFDGGATETGRPYFVMELVRGMRITDYCDQNDLSTERRLNLFIQVCHAIQHAHQKGVIHRDIKPSNILVTVVDGQPVPKVIDFGIAKATQGQLTDKTVYTQLHQFIGTPAYMSPEQAALSAVDVDTRSDIYSLGVLLYELLTAHTPFDPKPLLSAGLDEMRRMIREQEPPRPSTRISTLDEAERTTVAKHRQAEPGALSRLVRGDLDWIVMKCLEKDRGRRYETANNVALDVEHHLRQEPVSAVAPSTVYRAGKFIRRHKVGLAMAAGVVLVLAGGAVVSAWQAVRATRAERAQSRLRAAAEQAEAKEAGLRLQAEEARTRAEANEQKATTEAARSQQVAQFMKDMLKGVGPKVAMGRDTRLLREILDNTAERTGRDLKDQPEVAAELLSTIGETYLQLFDFDRAEAMQREALRLRRTLFGETNAAVAASLTKLAQVLIMRRGAEDFRQAEAMTRQALAIWRQLPGKEDEEVARSVSLLGAALVHQGKLAEAESRYREALAMFRRVLGNEQAPVASVLHNLGGLLRSQRKFGEAEQAIREALVIQKKVCGEEHPDVADSLYNLGWVFADAQRVAEAEAAFRECLGMRRKLMGDDHPQVAVAFDGLVSILRTQGKQAQLDQLFREELAARRKAGEANPSLARLLYVQADALQAQGKLAEAETALREALAVQKKVLGDHRDTVLSLKLLGAVLEAQKKPAEAEALYREALAMGYRVLRPGHADVESAFDRLANLLQTQGKQAQLDDILADKAVAATSRTNPMYLDTLAAAYAVSGQFANAVKAQQEAIALLQNEEQRKDYASRLRLYESGSPYHDHFELADRTWNLLGVGRFGEAEPLARECLALCEKLIPEEWWTFNARSMLGACLLGQKKYAEAEPLLVAAYEGLKWREHRIPPAAKPRLREALERLVQLNESLAVESPGNVEDRQQLAAAYRQLLNLTTNAGPLAAQDCSRALALTDKIIALARSDTNTAPGEAALWHDKGKLLEAAGRREEALQAMTKAIELASTNTNGYPLTSAKARLSRSDLLRRMSRLAEAGDDRCQALNFPRRDPQAKTNLVDLSLFYNGNLEQNRRGGIPGNNLGALPEGVRSLADVQFDVRGLIQLAGTNLRDAYPPSVAGIPIHRRFAQLHVLHATNFSEADATRIGAYVLHYEDGQERELPIRYGEDVLNWWRSEKDLDATQAAVAWTGQNPAATKSKATLRLFKRTWENPRPEVEVESIDFTSTVTQCAPFLIALTLE